MDADTYIGHVIGNYRIVAKVGEGGFGYVYQAKSTIPDFEDRVVAIKVLRVDRNIPKARERFLQEARVLLKLKHPYILPSIDLTLYEDHLCLITDYAANGSLRDRIRLSPHLLPLQDVRLILSQVGQALQYIHQQGIIHRDLKPENILFNAQGEAMLADFGIAKIVAAASAEEDEMAEGITGTPQYMAPEQFQGRFSELSDQYAFACMTYKLLVGHTPFSGTGIELLQKHLTQLPTDPRTFNPDIPDYMAEAILKALAKNPADRHGDIHAYLTALRIPYPQESVSQKDVEELLDKAMVLLRDGHLEDALKIYDQTIKLEPESAKAYCGKGDVFLQQHGRRLDALASYNQAISFDPEFLPAYIGKGNALYLLGRSRSALEEYQKVAKAASDPVLYQRIAHIHIQRNEYKAALAAYDGALRCGTNPLEIHKKKIEPLISLGSYAEAVGEYDFIIRLSSDPLALYYEKRDFLLYRIRQYDEALAIHEIFATYAQIITLKHGAIEVYAEEIAFLEKLVDDNDDKRLAMYDRILNIVPNAIKVSVYYKKAALLEKLNRFQEVPAICDWIIELAPEDIAARSKKLEAYKRLGWPEETLEDGLVTCDQIIVRMPHAIDAYHTKRDLLWELQRYDHVVDTCHQILALDSQSDYTYYRMAQAYEMLAKANGRGKDDVLSVRLTPVPSHYLDALSAYENASQLVPDNLDYRESKGKLLRHLKKFNRAEEATNRIGGKNPTVSRLYWLLSFLSLPFLVNAALLMIVLLILQHLWMWEWVSIGALCISVVGAMLISVSDRRSPFPRYHLYHASILFYPIACFSIGWFIVGFLALYPEVTASFIFSLVCLFVSGFLNTGVYFFIDGYEEHTFVFIERAISKIVEGIGIAVIIIWTLFVEMLSYIIDEYKKDQHLQRERQKAIAVQKKAVVAQNVLLNKSAARQAMFPKGSPRQKNQVKLEKCPNCRGKGRINCHSCGGRGYERNPKLARKPGATHLSRKTCSRCQGRGNFPCPSCKGKGKRNITSPFDRR